MSSIAPGREGLHQFLVAILGSAEVYMDPPENLKMRYPAIVYTRTDVRQQYADDGVYLCSDKYEIVVVSRTPMHPATTKLLQTARVRFNKHYVVNGLHHDVMTLEHI